VYSEQCQLTAAYIYGKRMHWPSVGRAYCRLARRLVEERAERRAIAIPTPSRLHALRRQALPVLPLGQGDLAGRSKTGPEETSLAF
jgi:hypothetical protein